MNVLQTQKVTFFSGQEASISDWTQNYFVTGVHETYGHDTYGSVTVQQPNIEIIKAGQQLDLRCELLEDGSVSLKCNMVFNTIDSVAICPLVPAVRKDSSGCEEPSGYGVVQVPTVSTTCIRLPVTIPKGKVLLIANLARLKSEQGDNVHNIRACMIRCTSIVPEKVAEKVEKMESPQQLYATVVAN